MIIGVPKEIREGETRVAATPESVKKLVKKGLQVHIESCAGDAASFYEKDYIAAGAQIVNAGQALGADIVLKVNKPSPQEILQFKKGALLISFLNPITRMELSKSLPRSASMRWQWNLFHELRGRSRWTLCHRRRGLLVIALF